MKKADRGCSAIKDQNRRIEETPGRKSKTMKTIIAGSRHINDYDIIFKAIEDSGFKITEVVSGAAKGVDSIAVVWGEWHGIPAKLFPAEWDDLEAPGAFVTVKNGRMYNVKAGFQRNQKMADYADALILIWDGYSKGSADMLRRAKKNSLKIFEVRTDKKRAQEVQIKGGA